MINALFLYEKLGNQIPELINQESIRKDYYNFMKYEKQVKKERKFVNKKRKYSKLK